MAEPDLSALEIELGIKKLLNFSKANDDRTETSETCTTASAKPEENERHPQKNDSIITNVTKNLPTLNAPTENEDDKGNANSEKKTRKRRSEDMVSATTDDNVRHTTMFVNDFKTETSDVENHNLQITGNDLWKGGDERKILKAKRSKRKSNSCEDIEKKIDFTQKEQEDEKNNEKTVAAVKKFWELPVKKEKKKRTKKKKGKQDEDQKEEAVKMGQEEAEMKKVKKSGMTEEGTKEKAVTVAQTHSKTPEPTQSELVKMFEKDRIFPLRKKATRFPQAKFFCRLCDYHMDLPSDCERHMKDSRHKRRKEINIIQNRLEKMPPAVPKQIKALDELVTAIYEEQALEEKDLDYRVKVSKELEVFLQKTQTGIHVVLYGSSQTGLALKDSDVNMDLTVTGDQSQASALTKALKVMKESKDYHNVKSDFSAKVPCIYFTDRTQTLKCQLTIAGSLAPQTSTLLNIYSNIDSRVRILGIVFRYFAKVCNIDRQEEGTLPSYCYALLTVFYLQRCKAPVLPVLDLGFEDECKSPTKRKKTPPPEEVNFKKIQQQSDKWRTDNTMSVGGLWLDMLRFYCLEFDTGTYVVSLRQEKLVTRSDKKWNTKRVAIEVYRFFRCTFQIHNWLLPDAVSGKDILQCDRKFHDRGKSFKNYVHLTHRKDTIDVNLTKSYFYFSLPTNFDNLTDQQKDLLERMRLKEKAHKLAKSQNAKNNSKQQSDVTEEEEKDDDKADEESDDNSDVVILGSSEDENDPNTPDVNKTKKEVCDVKDSKNDTESNQQQDVSKLSPDTETTVGDTVLTSDFNTGSVDKTSTSISEAEEQSHAENVQCSDSCDSCEILQPVEDSDEKSLSADIPSLVNIDPLDSSNGLVDTISELTIKDQKNQTVHPQDSDESLVKQCETLVLDDNSVSDKQSSEEENRCKSETNSSDISEPERSSTSGSDKELSFLEYKFEFLEKIFTDGKGPLIICSICEKEGHLKNACPDETLPDLKPLPQMTKEFMKILSSTIERVPRDFGMNEVEYNGREMIREELEQFIQELYPDARLHLFGSSDNGFGFKHSDLDLCVTFQGRETNEGLDPVEIIEELTQKLKKHRGLYNVFPIATAKVPIVKFKHRQSGLEGDISLYNLLALYNTQMIQLYASLDQRVKCLGYAIKVFAKVCEIGDASRGSLSSYAYILLLIHYLQQCKPPVLPVLQELYPGRKPERIIDGWNTWYLDDVEKLQKIWKCKNRQTLGELWFGLFNYYTEEFHIKENVVCIRSSEILTKFEKLWNGKCIAIEDPFDLAHNLGGGLSRKMNRYIMKTLIRGRELYGTPADIPEGFETPGDYFFDKKQLSQGAPPSDRCCRVCNKIGHIARECPKVQQRKEREEREKKKKDRRQKAEERRRTTSEDYDEEKYFLDDLKNYRIVPGNSHNENVAQRRYDNRNVSHGRNMSQGRNTSQGRYKDGDMSQMSQGQYKDPKGIIRSKSDPYEAEVQDRRRQQYNTQRTFQRQPSRQMSAPGAYSQHSAPGQRSYPAESHPGNYGPQHPVSGLSESFPPPRLTVSPMKQNRDLHPSSPGKQMRRPLLQEPSMSANPPNQKTAPGHPWMQQYMPQHQQQGTPSQSYPVWHISRSQHACSSPSLSVIPMTANGTFYRTTNLHPSQSNMVSGHSTPLTNLHQTTSQRHMELQGTVPSVTMVTQGRHHLENIPAGSQRQVSMASNPGNTGPANIGISIPNEMYRQSSHHGNQGNGSRGGGSQRKSYKHRANQQRRK